MQVTLDGVLSGHFFNPVITGTAKFADGSASLPSITNAGDLNTGFWFSAADTINASVAGSEVLEVDATAITIATGTDLVMGALDKLYLDGGGNTYIQENSADQISFIVGGAVNKITSTYWSMPATNKLYIDGGGNTYIFEESADDIHIVVGGVSMMQIDQDIGAITLGASVNPTDYVLLDIGGSFASGGTSTIMFGVRTSGTLTAANGDTDYMNGTQLAHSITTMNNSETVLNISQLRLVEPGVTKGNDTVNRVSTLWVSSVATEGTVNNGIYMAAGAFEVSDGQGTSGEQLASGGANGNLSWTAAGSERSSKTAIVERDNNDEVLATLVNTPVHDFKYINDPTRPNTGDYDTDYVGIIADEAPWAMHHSGRILNPINTFGYTVQAFKALEKRIQELESK